MNPVRGDPNNQLNRNPRSSLPSLVENKERHIEKMKTIAIIGPTGAGKTTLLERFADATRKRHPSIMSEEAMIYPVDFTSNHGKFRCNLLDIPDNMELRILKTILYSVDGIVLLFDLQSSDPFPAIRNTHARIKSLGFRDVSPKPVLLCGNKVDLLSGTVRATVRATMAARFAKVENFNWYYEMCALANHRIIEPFVLVALLVEGLPDLNLISLPSLAPPETAIPHLQEQEQVERSIYAVLKGVDNRINYSLTVQRAFVQQQRDKLLNFYCEDDERV